MKYKSQSLISFALIFVICLGLLIYIPKQVSALTWSQLTSTYSANPSTIDVTPTSNNGWSVFLNDGSGDNKLRFINCNDISSTCDNVAGVAISSASAPRFNVIKGISGPVICADVSSSIVFTRSTNNLFSQLTTVSTPSSAGACSVIEVTSSKYVVAYHESSTLIKLATSTDSGNTWTISSTTITTTTDAVDIRLVLISNQNYELIYAQGGTSSVVVKTCKTTDDTSTWTCITQSSSAVGTSGIVNKVDMVYAGSNIIYGIYRDTPTSVMVIKSLDGGLSWFNSGISQTAEVYSLVAKNTTVLAIGLSSLGNQRIAYSTNGASTFTIDTVATNVAACAGATQMQANDLLILQDGNIGFVIACSAGSGGIVTDYTANLFSTTGSSVESISISNGVGMYVDPSGQLIAARTDSGTYVRSYNAQNLAGGALGSVNTPNCPSGRTAVMAEASTQQVIGYTTCAANGDNNYIYLQSPAFTQLDSPSGCGTDDTGACASRFQAASADSSINFPNFASMKELNSFDQTYGLALTTAYRPRTDCIFNSDENKCAFVRQMAWTFSTAPTSGAGVIGVDTITLKDASCPIGSGCQDERHEVKEDYSPSATAVDHLCTNGYRMIGAQQSTTTKQYQINLQKVVGDGTSTDLIPSMNQLWSQPGVRGSAVGCSNNISAVIDIASNPVVLRVFRSSDGQSLGYTIPVTSSQIRGLNCAQDRPFCAFVDGTVFKVFNTTSGTITGSFTLPSGTFKEIKIDRGAQTVWVMTSTTIARYVVYAATTINPAPILPPTTASIPTTTATGAQAEIDSLVNIETTNGKIMLSLVIMVILMIAGAVFAGVWGALGLATVGFASFAAIGWIPKQVVFLVVLLDIVTGFILFKRG